jgi:enamidase
MNGFGELALAKAARDFQKPGPWIDATAPYLEGPGLPLGQVHALTGPDDARRLVNYWADMGATSFKAYMHITRDELQAAAEEAHKRGLKITGHLCSVTYREAADAGIDDLEHGFIAATDFVKDKKPGECPGQGAGQATIAALDPGDPAFTSLVRHLVSKRVAITSTLTVFETFTPGRPLPPGLDVLTPQLKSQFEQRWQNAQRNTGSAAAKLFPNAMKLELAFFRAGGLLVSGTDPTGGGGVVPGYSNQRQVELMVEAGLTPVEAIKVATHNGATYLGIGDRTGTITVGKQADLVLLGGDPSTDIGAIRNVEIVFRQGVGFDPARLIASVRGMVGIF